jgi:hypothetical protein
MKRLFAGRVMMILTLPFSEVPEPGDRIQYSINISLFVFVD